MEPFAEDFERLWFLIGKFGGLWGFWRWVAFERDGVEVVVEVGDLGTEFAFGESERRF